MPDLNIEIQTYGGRVMRRRLARLENKVRYPRAAFQEAYDRFRELMQIHFGGEGRGPSGPWAPLQDATVARKMRLGLDPRILHETLTLRSSLTSKGARGAVFRTQGDTAIFGTSIPYSRRHQGGTVHMPARPPIDLHAGDKREIVETIQEWLSR